MDDATDEPASLYFQSICETLGHKLGQTVALFFAHKRAETNTTIVVGNMEVTIIISDYDRPEPQRRITHA